MATVSDLLSDDDDFKYEEIVVESEDEDIDLVEEHFDSALASFGKRGDKVGAKHVFASPCDWYIFTRFRATHRALLVIRLWN